MPAIVVNNIAGAASLVLTVIIWPPVTALRLSIPKSLLKAYTLACFSLATSSIIRSGASCAAVTAGTLDLIIPAL